MMNINERIKNFRNQLHLSQEYVANFLGINRATYTQMEYGKRKITAEDVSRLSELFGVTADALLNENKMSQPAAVFARSASISVTSITLSTLICLPTSSGIIFT